MTNHIEQLMKAAGAKPEIVTDYELNEYKVYPDFTPAKQLELIKLIGQQSGFYIHQNEGMDWLLSDSIYADLSFNTQGYSYSSFENALCKLTINLLKKKALNKSEVKRILEDDTNL